MRPHRWSHQVDGPQTTHESAEEVKCAQSVRPHLRRQGKKVVHFDMQADPPPDAQLKQL